MDQELRENKYIIRLFMRANYTDERLISLLAHAQSGRLSFCSCCCFIGTATSDHALQGEMTELCITPKPLQPQHLRDAYLLPLGTEANRAYCGLADNDSKRRHILIPMIRAEFKRRDAIRQQSEWKQELVEMST